MTVNNKPLSSSPCRASYITDCNQFHGLNVRQLCRPPPFVTFDLTTLPLTAPLRLLHLRDVTPFYPITQLSSTACDIGALEPKQLAGSHIGFPPLIMECFDGKLLCINVVAVSSEQHSGI